MKIEIINEFKIGTHFCDWAKSPFRKPICQVRVSSRRRKHSRRKFQYNNGNDPIITFPSLVSSRIRWHMWRSESRTAYYWSVRSWAFWRSTSVAVVCTRWWDRAWRFWSDWDCRRTGAWSGSGGGRWRDGSSGIGFGNRRRWTARGSAGRDCRRSTRELPGAVVLR